VVSGRLVAKQTYSSPMSFVGSARRLTRWARRGWWAWPLAIVALIFMWTFLVLWYLIVFGLFGIITVPLRLHRRGQRKSLAVQQAQLEEMRKLAERSGPPEPE
jgi:Flp pilus assembly protein TadB